MPLLNIKRVYSKYDSQETSGTKAKPKQYGTLHINVTLVKSEYNI